VNQGLVDQEKQEDLMSILVFCSTGQDDEKNHPQY
jgi:hypothetical protein